jgi:hypothetical protein
MNAKQRFEQESGTIRARMQTIHAWAKAHPEPDRNARLRDIFDDLPSSNALTALLATVADARDAALARELCEGLDAHE